MKKKIIIAGLLMTGVLSLNSCVKDNESDAVQNQRNAQTEKIKAEAAKELAEAEVKKAEAAVQNANAELAKAKQQYLVEIERLKVEKEKLLVAKEQDTYDENAAGKAETIEANILDAKAGLIESKKALETATAAYEKTISVQVEAAVAAAKVEAENSLAQSKKNRLDDLVSKLGDYQTKFTIAVSDVVDKQNELNELELQIAEAKAGTTSVEELYKKYLESKKADIEKQKAIIEAYKEYASTNNTDATYAKLEAANVAYQAAQKATKAAGKEAVSANEEFEKMDFESMLDLKAGESDSELSFFEALDKLHEINPNTVNNVEAIASDNVRAKLEEEGKPVEYDLDDSKTFSTKTIKTYKKGELVSRFINPTFISSEVNKIKADAAQKRKDVDNAQTNLDNYASTFKTAQDDYNGDPKDVTKANAYSAAIVEKRNREDALATAKKELEKAEGQATDLEKYRKQAEEGEEEVIAKIAEYMKAQEPVVAKAKVYKEKADAEKAAKDKKEAIEEVLGDDTKPLTVEGAKAKIEEAEEKIANLEAAILDISGMPTTGAKDVIAQMEKDKQTLEFELEKAKQERDAYKKAFDQAVEDLKAFQNS